jgi:hypothetical protein
MHDRFFTISKTAASFFFVIALEANMASNGTRVSFLGKLKKNVTVPTVPQPPAQRAQPAFHGTVEDFVAHHKCASPNSISPAGSMLHNRVKKCGVCGKPNGFTLHTCNQCGHSLTTTDITHTPNVFMGFVLGIEKGPFPLTISVRYQDTHTIVFDDLLALSPLHLNVIPTSHFIPDWRYLLRRPQQGLLIIKEMLSRCEEVANEQFLHEDSDWRRAFLRPSPKTSCEGEGDDSAESSLPIFDAAQHMCCGFNYPPSQSQLHLQYICPNVMPFQYAQFLNGVHFTFGRFFPFGYVKRCLELLTNATSSVESPDMPPDLLTDDADVESIIQYFGDVHHHDYAAAHATYLRTFVDLSGVFSNWQSEWFEGVVVPHGNNSGRGVLLSSETSDVGAVVVEVSIAEVAAGDKSRLQCYGRPYHPETGKPTGSYYAFPKQPDDIEVW